MGDETTILTAEERRVARHALGLPNLNRESYRNRYSASLGNPAEARWRGMVERGIAELTSVDRTMAHFALTRSGALAALDKGERLDREDFPL